MGEIKIGKASIPKQVNIDLLRKVCSVLNKSGIDYFLTCGTLLGYIREGDFIEWDSDIDLGVFEIEEFERIIPDLISSKLAVNKHSPNHGIHMSLSYQITDLEYEGNSHPHLDIFTFEKTSKGILFRMVSLRNIPELVRRFLLRSLPGNIQEETANQGIINRLIEDSGLRSRFTEKLKVIWSWARYKLFHRQYKHIFEPFTPVEETWFDFLIKIPSNPEDHLRLLFGDNWRIPNPEYSRSLERQKNIRRVRL